MRHFHGQNFYIFDFSETIMHDFKLLEKRQALQRGHLALLNMKLFPLFSIPSFSFWPSWIHNPDFLI
jgi:hypothetical protein